LNNLKTLWSSLTPMRRVIVVGAAAMAFTAILMLSRMAATQDTALLFSGLDAAAAGDVVTALETRGVAYEIRGNAIFVPTAERDTLRMMLASEGLPANTGQGYELLDTLSGFGTTSQMFDAAYLRAKEGELARTIVSNPLIRAARVHISVPPARSFQRDVRPTAAVTVTTANGSIPLAQVRALKFLIASAVSGMSPDDVAVIDGAGGLIGSTDDAGEQTGMTNRNAQLRHSVERLLEARLGLGNAVVEVSVDTVTERESIIERTVDPDSRVAISTEVEERSTTAQDSRGGNVTVASNLPAGDGAADPGASSNENSETRSLTNYEVSEIQREIQRAPGAIKRITVAVLVNDAVTVGADGISTSTPRGAEELDALRGLVASAVGFDADRGDEITIHSMAFEPVLPMGTASGDVAAASTLNIMSLIQLAVLAGVALILGLFVVRPILTSNARRAPQLPPPPPALVPQALDGEVEDANAPMGGNFAIAARGADQNGTPEAAKDPVSRLRQLIDERQDESLQILQSWIEDPDEARAT